MLYSVTVGSGQCLGSVQNAAWKNVVWEACKMAAAERGVRLSVPLTKKTKLLLPQHHVKHQGSRWCFKQDNPVSGEAGGACTMCTASFANHKIRSLGKD